MQHLVSRESMTSATDALLSVAADLDDSGLQTLGSELSAVAALLRREATVRRALADSSVPAATRSALAERLLSPRVGVPTLQVVSEVVAKEWASSIDLRDGLARLGRTAMFLRAERVGDLDDVEDQIFRFGRILAAHPELAVLLDDQTGRDDAKRDLVQRLIGDKAAPLTVELLTNLALDTHGRSFSYGLDQLVEEAAQRQEKVVAVVTSAVALTDAQTERLTAGLQRIYRRPVLVHVDVDRDLVGGLTVRVGDEVIDGSISGRIAELKARLS
jgi:F-type H+-transporting ATPase subunit delta